MESLAKPFLQSAPRKLPSFQTILAFSLPIIFLVFLTFTSSPSHSNAFFQVSTILDPQLTH